MTKTPSQTYTEQVNLVRASDLNGSKRLFGGNLLSWIDITAAIVAGLAASFLFKAKDKS